MLNCPSNASLYLILKYTFENKTTTCSRDSVLTLPEVTVRNNKLCQRPLGPNALFLFGWSSKIVLRYFRFFVICACPRWSAFDAENAIVDAYVAIVFRVPFSFLVHQRLFFASRFLMTSSISSVFFFKLHRRTIPPWKVIKLYVSVSTKTRTQMYPILSLSWSLGLQMAWTCRVDLFPTCPSWSYPDS